MAIIDRLALSMGGGIISLNQQAKQAENTVNILIGLGGTGVDCIREIKTQVYSRIEPDDGVNSIDPTYKHIRFLGVDADKSSVSDFDREEVFFLSGSDAKNAKQRGTRATPEYHWVSDKLKDLPLKGSGAGGIRQVGRYLLMSKSDEFKLKLERIIGEAIKDTQEPEIAVHIFSGIGGGTGSGTFLDVCYIVREVIKDEKNAYVAGYFFMPDINVSHVKDDDTKKYIPINGYAAMQELDYCMNLPENNGSFKQMYKGRYEIDWNKPPVDYCHLISAINDSGAVREDAYSYAMKVASEYAMEFLVEQKGFTMKSYLDNTTQKCNYKENEIVRGYNVGYLAIGASCASVPVKEINTYLASRIFEIFNNNCKVIPNADDVNRFAIDVLGASQIDADIIEKIYEHLYSGLQGRAADDYIKWDGTAKEIKTQGNEGMVFHYENQTSNKIGILKKQSSAITDLKNKESLIKRLHKEMYDNIITNIYCGPTFGYNILKGANTYSLNNILDGLIALNSSRLAETDKYTSGKRKAVIEAQKAFEESNFFNEKSTFNEYVRSVWDEQQHTYRLETYKAMDSVIRTFQQQFDKACNNIYGPLKDIFIDLKDTFENNRDILKSGKIVNEIEGFDNALVDINDPNMKKALESELRKNASAPNVVFKNLVSRFMENMDCWESEQKISKLVTEFFVGKADGNHAKGIFAEFASNTIDNFLKIKYDIDDPKDLSKKIKDEWLGKLSDKAAPLFYKNGNVYDISIAKQGRLSVPSQSVAIHGAAEDYVETDPDLKVDNVATTGSKDRIFILKTGCGFPISALKGIQKSEKDYYSAADMPGTHYYEGMKDAINIEFDDWYNLPLLTPMSYLIDNFSDTDGNIKYRIEKTKKLFKESKEYGLCDKVDRDVCIVKKISDDIVRMCDNIKFKIDDLIKGTKNGDFKSIDKIMKQKNDIFKSIDTIKNNYKNPEFYNNTDIKLRIKGKVQNEADNDRLIMDSLAYSPVAEIELKKSVEQINSIRKTIDEFEKQLDEKLPEIDEKIKDYEKKEKRVFFDALFRGVISLKGRTSEFIPVIDGIERDTIYLSRSDDEFRYNSVSPYQAYINYRGLDEKNKNALKEMVNKKIDEFDSDRKNAKETLLNLEINEVFSDSQIKVWYQRARDDFSSESEEIQEFIADLKKRFNTFCEEYNIEH